MNIYIAGISGDTQYVKSLRTFYEIIPRPGDIKQERASGRGDIARMLAGDDFFFRKECGAIAMFDLDMLHPPDILERLRDDMERGNLDMVTGHYYARNAKFVHSIIWEVGDNRWPFVPMIDVPASGMHEVAITGMGCVLIKREVFEAVASHLPPGDHPFSIGPAPEVTGDARVLGTDFRFFSLARHLGYKLWLDAEVESAHATVVWMDRQHAEMMADDHKTFLYLQEIARQIGEAEGMDRKFLQVRVEQLKARIKDLEGQHEQAAKNADFLMRQINSVKVVLSEDLYLLQEIDKAGEFPTVPDNHREAVLAERTGIPGVSEAEAKTARESVQQREAQGWVEDIQAVRNSGELPGNPG